MQTKILIKGLAPQIAKKCGYLLVITMLLAGNIRTMFADNDAPVVLQQQITVTGVVNDDLGDPLPGVTILLKGSTSVGTQTLGDGRFSINLPDQNPVLVFSYIGFTTKEITVGSQRNLTVTLNEDTQQLDEVIITGYTTQRRATMTGSISSVSNKELTITKNENVVNALAGKLPGLRVMQKTSRPGSYETSIDIRGLGSPLFVVDGIPRDQGYFARMDPEEIESVTILKDASAAIYGMQAANGVMLITTRQGTAQQGKVDISYTGTYQFQHFNDVPRGVSVTDFFTLKNEAALRGFNYNNFFQRRNLVHGPEDFALWEGKHGDNWMDIVLAQNVPQYQHNVNLNGGNEQLRYFVNLGYFKQEGAFSSGDVWSDKINFRSNVDAKITKNLSVRVALAAIIGHDYEPNDAGWTTYKNAWLNRPTSTYYANNNPLYLNGDNIELNDGVNTIAQTTAAISGFNDSKSRRMNATGTMTYDIPGVKGLQVYAMYDYTMNINDSHNYKKMYYTYTYSSGSDTYNPISNRAPSTITRSGTFSYNTTLQTGFRYNNKWGDHGINGVGVFEETYRTSQNFSAMREVFVNSEWLSVAENNANQRATGNTPTELARQGFIGTLNYDYVGKYLVDFRFRYDSSSKWARGARWGFFPSLSLGWRFSEEPFIKNNFDFVSNLKLRASIGQMGDDSSGGNYPPIFSDYSLTSNLGWYWDGATISQGVNTASLPNPKLTWYKTTMKNLALDWGLLKNQFSGSFEVFRRDQTGLLATSSVVIPNTIGASLPQENLNSNASFGWEIDLNYSSKRNRDFTYSVSTNWSFTRSMRTKWLESEFNNSMNEWNNKSEGRYTEIRWSRRAIDYFRNTNEIMNFTAQPISQGALPGYWWFEDWNEDGISDGSDSYPYSTNGLARINGGISVSLSYKNIDLTLHFQGAYGVYASYSEVYSEALPFGGNRNSMYYFTDRWRPVNYTEDDWWHPDTKWISGYYPPTGNGDRFSQSNAIKDASFIRLKTADLSYNVPRKLLALANIKSLKIFVSGYNLYTLTKMAFLDPERPGSGSNMGTTTNSVDMYQYPINQTYNFGINLKF